MTHEHDFEALLSRALDRRGRAAPFSVDVSDRVMARVAELGPPRRTEMGLRQFVRWAAAAAVAGAALTAAAFWWGPSLTASASGSLHALADAQGAVLKLAGPAQSLAGALGRVALAVLASAQTVVQPLVPFQPLARAMLALVAAGMLSVTTFIVGRDLRTRAADKERA